MARAFDITTTSPTLRLDEGRRGEVAFTVTNALGQPVRGRAVVVPEGSTPPEWFSLVDEAEREFPRDGTHVFHVRLSIPPSQPAGEHAFHLLVVDASNPDERFADGPPVAFRVPAPVVAPRRRFPWWIPVSAAAALLLLVLVGLLVRGRQEDAGTGGAGPPVTEPEPETPASSVLAFNGTSTYVDLGQPLSLEVTGPLTLEAWVRPTTPSGIMNIVARGYVLNPSGEIYLRILHGNYQAGSYMDGKGFGGVSAQMPAQDVNQWVYVTAVFDGEKWRLFRNAELLVEAPHAGGGGFPIAARWAIGARGGGERFFNGNIRDVRIWDVARTQEQIRQDMNNPPSKDEEGLLGFWPLGEGSGRRAVDHSGNEGHGFIHNGQWGPP